MRVFVTGASGWIGSAVVAELLGCGPRGPRPRPLGRRRPRRSRRSAPTCTAATSTTSTACAPARRRPTASSTSATTTTSPRWQEAAQLDRRGRSRPSATALEGTGRPLVDRLRHARAGARPGRHRARPARPRPAPAGRQRAGRAGATPSAACAPRSSGSPRPCTATGDHGFIADARRHRPRQGRLGVRRRRRQPLAGRAPARRRHPGPPGGRAMPRPDRSLHAVAEEGVPTREIAEAIGRGLDLPVVSVPAEEAADHFGWIGTFFGADAPGLERADPRAARLGADPSGSDRRPRRGPLLPHDRLSQQSSRSYGHTLLAGSVLARCDAVTNVCLQVGRAGAPGVGTWCDRRG